MKQQHRNNLVRLIFIHLLLLAYPMVNKTFHVHHGERHLHTPADGVQFNHSEEPCPVCDFEFNLFEATKNFALSVQPRYLLTINSPEPPISYLHFTSYFSLRAPPVS